MPVDEPDVPSLPHQGRPPFARCVALRGACRVAQEGLFLRA